jgi:hypothetical protein
VASCFDKEIIKQYNISGNHISCSTLTAPLNVPIKKIDLVIELIISGASLVPQKTIVAACS